METSNSNPQINRGYSPLETQIMQVLREFGDYSASGARADTILMFIGFANRVIDEVRSHPYWTGEDVSYYEHASDIRPIPDIIIHSGLFYYYAVQQTSEKAGASGQQFLRDLNRGLYYRLNGNTPLQLHVVDGGSNRDNANGKLTNTVNGTTT